MSNRRTIDRAEIRAKLAVALEIPEYDVTVAQVDMAYQQYFTHLELTDEPECGCTDTTTCEECEEEAALFLDEIEAEMPRITAYDPFYDYERRTKPLD